MAITKNADRVLSYVLAEGGHVPAYSHLPACEDLPSQRILNLLIVHGWDINARRRSSEKPFLWEVVADHDLVVWALDHGASVQPRDQEPYTDNQPLRDHTDCPPLLEEAVLYGCHPSTFDLLRSKGAPLCRRVLYFAVMKAAVCVEAFVDRRLALVRHLLDKYNLDVNASDHTVGNMGNHYGTPLCYVVYWGAACKDVVELLLERGADPDLCAYPGGWSAVTFAEQQKNFPFLDVIATWRRRSQ